MLTPDLDYLLNAGDDVASLGIAYGFDDVREYIATLPGYLDGPNSDGLTDAVATVEQAFPVDEDLMRDQVPERAREYETAPLVAAYEAVIAEMRPVGHLHAAEAMAEWLDEFSDPNDEDDPDEREVQWDYLRGAATALSAVIAHFGVEGVDLPELAANLV